MKFLDFEICYIFKTLARDYSLKCFKLFFTFRDDSENVEEDGGIIPFEITSEGLSPGKYFEDYLNKLSPDCDRIFQKPLAKKASRRGQLPWIPIWYTNAVVGETNIATFMPKLTQALGTDRATNGQIRRSTVEKFVFNKIACRKIAKITGHKNLGTLDNYNPGLTMDEKFRMAAIAGTSGIKQKVVVASKPTNSTDLEFRFDSDMEEDMLAMADNLEQGPPEPKKFKKSSDEKLFKKSSRKPLEQSNKENLVEAPMSKEHLVKAPMSKENLGEAPMPSNQLVATENSVKINETLVMPSSNVQVTDQCLLAFMQEQSLQLQRQAGLISYINLLAQKK